MKAALAISFLLFSLSAGFIGAAVAMTLRLAPERNQRQILNWLAAWFAKGVALPLLLWAVMNFGLSWNLPAFMPRVQAAQNGGGAWFGEWLLAWSTGLFVVSSYWASATLAWVLASTAKGVEGEVLQKFKALCWMCSVGLGVPAALIFWIGGWPMLGLALAVILGPLAGYAPGVLQAQKVAPMYARAIARMKFGKYAEAEAEIIRELEKSEDDFEGWLMLAELYATRFSDIAEAERTVLEICDQPRVTPSQISVALHRLADWQLKVACNPAAARRALQMIADLLKGTHLAHMAQLRLKQIPQTPEQLKEQQNTSRIPLPALGDSLDHPEENEFAHLDRKEAARQANACVEQLKADPNNTAAREKLARLFTMNLDRAELGIEQLQLLLDMPDQPDNKRADWLSWIAAWHLKHRDDAPAATRFLERLTEEFPGTPQALSARYRLGQLRRKMADTAASSRG